MGTPKTREPTSSSNPSNELVPGKTFSEQTSWVSWDPTPLRTSPVGPETRVEGVVHPAAVGRRTHLSEHVTKVRVPEPPAIHDRYFLVPGTESSQAGSMTLSGHLPNYVKLNTRLPPADPLPPQLLPTLLPSYLGPLGRGVSSTAPLGTSTCPRTIHVRDKYLHDAGRVPLPRPRDTSVTASVRRRPTEHAGTERVRPEQTRPTEVDVDLSQS